MENLSYPSPEHRNTEIKMISVFWDKYDKEDTLKNYLIDFYNKTWYFNYLENYSLNDMDNIHKKTDALWLDYNNISWFKVDNWVLVIQWLWWDIQIYNLFLNEEQFSKIQSGYEENKNNVNNFLQNQRHEYLENLDKEIVFWWVVLTYATSARTWNFFIEKFSVKNWPTTEVIELTEDSLNRGTKLQLKDRLFKIFEKKWYIFDAVKWSFRKLSNLENFKIKDISKIVTSIKNLDYKSYSEALIKNGDIPIEQKDFNKLKSSAIKDIELNKWNLSFSNIKKVLWKWLICTPLIEIVMLPAFFHEYHKNSSDLASLWIAFWEAWAFYAWMKIWQKLPGNFISKQIMWIVGWVWSIWWWTQVAQKLNFDKKFWIASPDREDYWDKKGWDWKSVTTHILTAWAINDIMDKVWFDLKIPWTPVIFAQTKLNTATHPLEYMQSAIWRDMSFWNERVELLKIELTESITQLIKDYQNNTWVLEDLTTFSEDFINYATFWKHKPEIEKNHKLRKNRKDKRFVTELYSVIFNNWKSEYFPDVQKQLYTILSENFESDFYKNDGNINLLVWNILDKMKIDSHSLNKISDSINQRNNILNGLLNTEFTWEKNLENLEFDIKYHELIKNEIHSNFIFKLFQRIVNKEQMLEPNITHPIWTKKTKDTQYYSDDFVPKLIEKSEDKILWEELIHWKNGDLFVELLNFMVEYKRDKEFYEKITTSWYAVEWNGI